MEEFVVPVYLIAGFLESGKTSFLQFTLEQEYFEIEGKTLLVVCEEGEVEYDMDSLARHNVVLEVIGSEEEFTTEKLESLQQKHNPERVVMEYNGMWLVSKLSGMVFPEDWQIEQHIVIVDASTFQLYMQNMKSLFMDMVRDADMVVFNRANQNMPLANFRRSVVVNNPRAQIIFEDENGELDDIFLNALPFDVDAPQIDLPMEDFGIFVVDAIDHPDKYEGKKVTFEGRLMHPNMAPANYYQIARPAMTCCSDDITMLGFVCKGMPEANLDPKDYEVPKGVWAKVSGTGTVMPLAEFQGEPGLVLKLTEVERCPAPADELVYFN